MIQPSIVLAQKCKPVVDEADKFTGARKIWYGDTWIENVLLSDKQQIIYLYWGSVNDTLYVQLQVKKMFAADKMQYYQEDKEDWSVKKGDHLYFALEGGNAISVTAASDSKLTKKRSMGGVDLLMVCPFGLTAEQLKTLGEYPITDMKLELANTTPLTAKVKSESKREKFRDLFRCSAERLLAKQ